jgi:hypothetical protein
MERTRREGVRSTTEKGRVKVCDEVRGKGKRKSEEEEEKTKKRREEKKKKKKREEEGIGRIKRGRHRTKRH